jgi:hypothetical protein
LFFWNPKMSVVQFSNDGIIDLISLLRILEFWLFLGVLRFTVPLSFVHMRVRRCWQGLALVGGSRWWTTFPPPLPSSVCFLVFSKWQVLCPKCRCIWGDDDDALPPNGDIHHVEERGGGFVVKRNKTGRPLSSCTGRLPARHTRPVCALAIFSIRTTLRRCADGGATMIVNIPRVGTQECVLWARVDRETTWTRNSPDFLVSLSPAGCRKVLSWRWRARRGDGDWRWRRWRRERRGKTGANAKHIQTGIYSVERFIARVGYDSSGLQTLYVR